MLSGFRLRLSTETEDHIRAGNVPFLAALIQLDEFSRKRFPARFSKERFLGCEREPGLLAFRRRKSISAKANTC